MDTPAPQEKSAVPAPAPGQYEFTSRQNDVIAPLARDMVWVAVPLQLVGVLYGIGLVLCVIRAFTDPHLVLQAVLIGLAMLFFLGLGTWTSRSAGAFKHIVTTQGQDISHLMDALNNLRKMYGLLGFIVKLYVGILAVALAVGLIEALITAFKS
jgi:hypothetical protein